MRSIQTSKIVYAAICLALALILPFLTGQIPQVGAALSPMHIAVFLCGFLCGWPYGLLVGCVAPFLRFALFGMPPLFPTGVAMAFELAAYGCLSGFLYERFPKRMPYLYLALILAMVGGRAVWGVARFLIAGLQGTQFPFSAFLAGAVTQALPGIVLHIALVPILVVALNKMQPKRV